jgi:hypothetical protein
VRSDPGLEGFVQLASAFACVGVSIGAIATISAPAAAVSFSVDAVSLHQALRVELGGGLIHGSECSTYDGFGACHDEFDRNGAFSPQVPVYGEGAVSVSTTVGANTVGADAWGGTTLEYSSDSARWGAGTFLVGRMTGSVSLRDSQPDQYHTWASASTAIDDRFDITVPSDQRLVFHLETGASNSRLTTEQSQLFRISSLADNQVLYETSGATNQDFDLSAYAGLPVRFEFQASVAMYGDSGFGNGATNFLTYFTSSGANFAFRQLPIPEPSTAVLLGGGLVALAVLRQSANLPCARKRCTKGT